MGFDDKADYRFENGAYFNFNKKSLNIGFDGLTPDQKYKYRSIFAKYDKNLDGVLDEKELDNFAGDIMGLDIHKDENGNEQEGDGVIYNYELDSFVTALRENINSALFEYQKQLGSYWDNYFAFDPENILKNTRKEQREYIQNVQENNPMFKYLDGYVTDGVKSEVSHKDIRDFIKEFWGKTEYSKEEKIVYSLKAMFTNYSRYEEICGNLPETYSGKYIIKTKEQSELEAARIRKYNILAMLSREDRSKLGLPLLAFNNFILPPERIMHVNANNIGSFVDLTVLDKYDENNLKEQVNSYLKCKNTQTSIQNTDNNPWSLNTLNLHAETYDLVPVEEIEPLKEDFYSNNVKDLRRDIGLLNIAELGGIQTIIDTMQSGGQMRLKDFYEIQIQRVIDMLKLLGNNQDEEYLRSEMKKLSLEEVRQIQIFLLSDPNADWRGFDIAKWKVPLPEQEKYFTELYNSLPEDDKSLYYKELEEKGVYTSDSRLSRVQIGHQADGSINLSAYGDGKDYYYSDKLLDSSVSFEYIYWFERGVKFDEEQADWYKKDEEDLRDGCTYTGISHIYGDDYLEAIGGLQYQKVYGRILNNYATSVGEKNAIDAFGSQFGLSVLDKSYVDLPKELRYKEYIDGGRMCQEAHAYRFVIVPSAQTWTSLPEPKELNSDELKECTLDTLEYFVEAALEMLEQYQEQWKYNILSGQTIVEGSFYIASAFGITDNLGQEISNCKKLLEEIKQLRANPNNIDTRAFSKMFSKITNSEYNEAAMQEFMNVLQRRLPPTSTEYQNAMKKVFGEDSIANKTQSSIETRQQVGAIFDIVIMLAGTYGIGCLKFVKLASTISRCKTFNAMLSGAISMGIYDGTNAFVNSAVGNGINYNSSDYDSWLDYLSDVGTDTAVGVGKGAAFGAFMGFTNAKLVDGVKCLFKGSEEVAFSRALSTIKLGEKVNGAKFMSKVMPKIGAEGMKDYTKSLREAFQKGGFKDVAKILGTDTAAFTAMFGTEATAFATYETFISTLEEYFSNENMSDEQLEKSLEEIFKEQLKGQFVGLGEVKTMARLFAGMRAGRMHKNAYEEARKTMDNIQITPIEGGKVRIECGKTKMVVTESRFQEIMQQELNARAALMAKDPQVKFGKDFAISEMAPVEFINNMISDAESIQDITEIQKRIDKLPDVAKDAEGNVIDVKAYLLVLLKNRCEIRSRQSDSPEFTNKVNECLEELYKHLPEETIKTYEEMLDIAVLIDTAADETFLEAVKTRILGIENDEIRDVLLHRLNTKVESFSDEMHLRTDESLERDLSEIEAKNPDAQSVEGAKEGVNTDVKTSRETTPPVEEGVNKGVEDSRETTPPVEKGVNKGVEDSRETTPPVEKGAKESVEDLSIEERINNATSEEELRNILNEIKGLPRTDENRKLFALCSSKIREYAPDVRSTTNHPDINMVLKPSPSAEAAKENGSGVRSEQDLIARYNELQAEYERTGQMNPELLSLTLLKDLRTSEDFERYAYLIEVDRVANGDFLRILSLNPEKFDLYQYFIEYLADKDCKYNVFCDIIDRICNSVYKTTADIKKVVDELYIYSVRKSIEDYKTLPPCPNKLTEAEYKNYLAIIEETFTNVDTQKLQEKTAQSPSAQSGLQRMCKWIDGNYQLTFEEIGNMINSCDFSSLDKRSQILNLCSNEVSIKLACLSDVEFEKIVSILEKRPEILLDEFDIKTFDKLINMSDAEYEELKISITERTPEAFDREKYETHIDERLSEEYQWDMSTWNAIRRSRSFSAQVKLGEPTKTVIHFDETKPIQHSTKEPTPCPTVDTLIERLETEGKITLSIENEGGMQKIHTDDPIMHESAENDGKVRVTDTSIGIGKARQWDDARIARDILQNFYDGNGHTLEGVSIEISKNPNGKYSVKIFGQGLYDYDRILVTGGGSKSNNNRDSRNAGQFGEGTMVTSGNLMANKGVSTVKYRCGEWILELGLSEPNEEGKQNITKKITSSKKAGEQYLDGNSYEFEIDDINLVESILRAKDYFYSPTNEDFAKLDYENEYFGIRFLPQGQKGNLYVVQRFEVKGQDGIDGTLDGITLVFKRQPFDEDIKRANDGQNNSFDVKDRNRVGLSKEDIQCMVERYAMTLEPETLIEIIGQMKNEFLLDNNSPNLHILKGFINAARRRNLKIDFGHDKYVAVNNNNTQSIDWLRKSGYIPVIEEMGKIGIQTLDELNRANDKQPVPVFNVPESQTKKLVILEEAVSLFSSYLDLANYGIITEGEARTPKYIVDKFEGNLKAARAVSITDCQGNYGGHWVLSDYLENGNFFELIATWLHENSHKVGGDGTTRFNDRLKLLEKLILDISSTHPDFCEKLDILYQKFCKIDGKLVERKLKPTESLVEALKDEIEELKIQTEEELKAEDTVNASEDNQDAFSCPRIKNLIEDRTLGDQKQINKIKDALFFAEWNLEEKMKSLDNAKTIEEMLSENKDARFYQERINRLTEEINNIESGILSRIKVLLFGNKHLDKLKEDLAVTEKYLEKTKSKLEIRYNALLDDVKDAEAKVAKLTTELEDLYAAQRAKISIYEIPNVQVKDRVASSIPTPQENLNKLNTTGRITVDIPRSSHIKPVKGNSSIRDEDIGTRDFDVTLDYNAQNEWFCTKIARDFVQNFYDGHRGTLDGVKFEIEKVNGKYKVRISGLSEYSYYYLRTMYASDKPTDVPAGGFGEGAKMACKSMLHLGLSDKITFASGDWICDFTAGRIVLGDKQLMQTTLSKSDKHLDGTYVEFETSSEEMVKAILEAKDYFKHSENSDFVDMDFDNPNLAFRILNDNERGNLYYVQRYAVAGKDLELPLQGILINFKAALTDAELAKISLRKDCDRQGFLGEEIRGISKMLMSRSSSNEEFIDAIKNLHKFFILTDKNNLCQYKREYTPEQQFALGVVDAAIEKGIVFDTTGLKIVAANKGANKQYTIDLLRSRGYIIVDEAFAELGFKTVDEVMENIEQAEPIIETVQEAQKIAIMQSVLETKLPIEIRVFEAKPDGEKVCLVRSGRERYIAVDRNYLEEVDFNKLYMEILSKNCFIENPQDWGYAMTNRLGVQLELFSDPVFTAKFNVAKKAYEELK